MPDDNTPRPVRVALSNDYELALLGLAQMLARHPEQVQVVDLTTRVEMAHEPDVILFDTFGRVPDVDGKLRKVIDENDALVVVYSWDEYPEDAARRAGAAGYLSKRLGAGELVAAIVALHDGREPEPGAGAADDADRTMTWPGQAVGLSEREAEMLTFIVRGLTNEEIARRSYLSINTVKTYVRTTYSKIGARNRAQAVAWGYRHGFESTDDTGF
ncbi:MAG TPA: response regulator transcription factor [Nocardioides sp.]|nr:response regulator transcription factor [Nocardioides sp.]